MGAEVRVSRMEVLAFFRTDSAIIPSHFDKPNPYEYDYGTGLRRAGGKAAICSEGLS